MMITLKFILKEKVNFMRLDLDPGCFFNGWIWIRFLIKGRIRTRDNSTRVRNPVLSYVSLCTEIEFGIYGNLSKMF